MITERLKAETAEHHKATEAVSFGHKIMSGTLTREEYTILIEKNYILHVLIENALVSSGLVPAEFELENRLKTQSLLNDLNLLNHPVPTVPELKVTFSTVAEALGAMYVVEGATLGGAYIYKALQRNPEFASLNGFNYYAVYGEKIGPNWKSFQEAINKHINTRELEDKTIESAKFTFDLFKAIFVTPAA
jgi:heme oxygenase